MKKFISKNDREQKTIKTSELQRLFEVYALDVVKIWKRTATGQIVMDMSVPYKPASQLFEEFTAWKDREQKNTPKK